MTYLVERLALDYENVVDALHRLGPIRTFAEVVRAGLEDEG